MQFAAGAKRRERSDVSHRRGRGYQDLTVISCINLIEYRNATLGLVSFYGIRSQYINININQPSIVGKFLAANQCPASMLCSQQTKV